MSHVSFSQAYTGVIPPYMLDHLSRHAGARVSQCAMATLRVDQRHGLLAQGQRAPRPTAPGAAPPPGQVRRAIYSAGNTMNLPGTLVRAEGSSPIGDPAADEAYDYLGATYAFFWQAYGRHSIDGGGLPLLGTVHYGQDYDNAFWDGTQMVFGDGDGEVLNRFTIAVDVVAHELAHGVIDSEAGLRYQGQSGALNESISDVFGALVKQHRNGQTASQADWLIGAGLFSPTVNARALRSMAQPGSAYDDPALGKDPQPDHMRDFVETTQDNGGVHINSGIPNRAFYLTATALGGSAWEQAGHVWYDTLCDPRLRPQADFAAFAALTLEIANGTPAVRDAVRQAWREVGVLT